jgi:hypothetical protein
LIDTLTGNKLAVIAGTVVVILATPTYGFVSLTANKSN